MKIAIMQPAFIPPASYLRLFSSCDVFVVLDDVQFNRRWYTHRQQLTNRQGKKEWITLPLKKKTRNTTMIMDLEWADDAWYMWIDKLKKFPIFDNPVRSSALYCTWMAPQVVNPLKSIMIILDTMLDKLVNKPKIYSSSLGVKGTGQERIINICKILGATEYINTPGGKDLYDVTSFSQQGISLKFLPDYNGNNDSVLERLQTETPEEIEREINANL